MSSQKEREIFYTQVMNEGFNRASKALAKFTKQSIPVSYKPSTVTKSYKDLSLAAEDRGNLYVLTTQIIGELSGKSYLVFSDSECDQIMKLSNVTMFSNHEEMKNGMLLEIDNILSASVVSEISDALNVEIYGDVPQIKVLSSAGFKDFILQEINQDEASSLVLSHTVFSFEKHETIRPQFIWKLNAKVLDKIPTEKLVVK